MDDSFVLTLCFLIYWNTLFFLVRRSRNWKRTLILNLAVQVIYSYYFLYVMSHEWVGLDWWFFLFMCIAIHWVLNLGLLRVRVKRAR